MAGAVAANLGRSDCSPASWVKPAYAQLLPATAFLLIFFVLPVGYVLALSVTDPTFSLGNFERVLMTPLYLRVLLNTFLTSGLVTLICLVLGYPLAYVISRRSDWIGGVLFAIVGLSFWTGFLVRTYAWLIVLGNSGPLAGALRAVGIHPVPQLIFTSFSSTLGMTHILLPYMTLSLASVMKRFDGSYLLAAESLGARPFTAFRLVFLPLSLPGVVNGSVLVFTICLGFYVTPILLGTPRNMMIAQLINQQIESLLDFGFASTLAAILLVITTTILLIYNRLFGLDRLWG
jgi:putative spermidine/putrescine transport system permease protein